MEEPLASEFRMAAKHWYEIADRQWRDSHAIASKTRLPQVFRAGDPVDYRQEAFVERPSVVGELEGQIMLSTGCPGLILYGRRRMGKSTILRNLSLFLPSDVHVVTVSMQNPRAFQSLASLSHLLAAEVSKACSGTKLPTESPTELSQLFDWLAKVNAALDQSGHRLIIGLDEYEQIDEKIGEKVFTIDLLAALRESIQSHRRITWVLAGSHDITELNHAQWTSFLVSVRTIEVPPFTPQETRLLLTEPLRHSKLWPDESKRPRFDPAFWGDGGIERIQAETAGWPHLVQLVAENAVDMVNENQAGRLDSEMMEKVFDKSIVRGENVLRLLMQTESVLPGEWDYLLGFLRRDSQPPPDDETLYTSLRRRLLVEQESGQWRLRVPLMQRWLRARA